MYRRFVLDRPEPRSPIAKLRLEMRPLPPDGLEAFFARQPLLHRLLERMTGNFIAAPKERLDRWRPTAPRSSRFSSTEAASAR